MFFIGELSIKDKRVDKMLSARNLTDADIYYSPIVIWLLILFMLFSMTYWFVFLLAFSKYYPVLLIYFACGYFICAYLNNSFALTQDTLIVINPNFPFRQFKSYPLTDIKQVIIDKTKHKWHFAFGIFGSNYIKIQTLQKNERYFCVGLELDTFDENWTDKSIEQLNYRLKEKGVQTVFNLDYD